MTAGHIRAEGDVDLRGCLGMDSKVPVGFTEIRLSFDIESDASPDAIDELLRVTEQYCVVNNTLRSGAKVDFGMKPKRSN